MGMEMRIQSKLNPRASPPGSDGMAAYGAAIGAPMGAAAGAAIGIDGWSACGRDGADCGFDGSSHLALGIESQGSSRGRSTTTFCGGALTWISLQSSRALCLSD